MPPTNARQSYFKKSPKTLAMPPAGWSSSQDTVPFSSPSVHSAKRQKLGSSPHQNLSLAAATPRTSSPPYLGDGFSSPPTPIGRGPPSSFSNYTDTIIQPGDGFTHEEIEKSKDPMNCVFNPTREYEKYEIGALEKGPDAVSFCGRVIGMSVQHGKCQNENAAKGWMNLIVADGTGAIMVKLYFSPTPHPLTLGTLVTIWTTCITSPSALNKDVQYQHPSCQIATSIFPGRDASVNIMIHRHEVNHDFSRLPLGFNPTKSSEPLPGIMNLKALIEGGHEVPDAKILVGVKSIGAKKTITLKKDPPVSSGLIEVVLFDDTGEITLSLWRETAESAREWLASETILLITRPLFRESTSKYGGKPILGLTAKSMVDVDPSDDWPDAKWLRNWLKDLRKRDSVKQEVPDGLWDEDITKDTQALFLLKDVDEWVREDPKTPFSGWLSLIILSLNLSLMRKRNMLCVTECCGIAIYGNTTTMVCPRCARPLSLSLNPAVIGNLVDETGVVGQGKLIWSVMAWEQLWGRSVKELVQMKPKEVGWLESRLLGLRLSMRFGWDEGVGRLYVSGVHWSE